MTFKCDRCSATAEGNEPPAGWRRVPSVRVTRTLCGDCAANQDHAGERFLEHANAD